MDPSKIQLDQIDGRDPERRAAGFHLQEEKLPRGIATSLANDNESDLTVITRLHCGLSTCNTTPLIKC